MFSRTWVWNGDWKRTEQRKWKLLQNRQAPLEATVSMFGASKRLADRSTAEATSLSTLEPASPCASPTPSVRGEAESQPRNSRNGVPATPYSHHMECRAHVFLNASSHQPPPAPVWTDPTLCLTTVGHRGRRKRLLVPAPLPQARGKLADVYPYGQNTTMPSS